ncbi:MAG TPA: YdcF family protein [Terriglobales bacterium]|nr:YdcF family protein [Terriglobales bacterium]
MAHRRSILLRILALVAVVFLFASAWIAARIVVNSRGDSFRKADAIVVFGAAEYAGRPSPVLKARLDHALDLFQQGLAPVVITTGGAGLDPVFSEGGVGRDYLMKQGVPDVNLIAETQGDDTAESARRVGAIMHKNHMRTALVVSDAYHIFRIKRMMRNEGVEAFGAPRPDSLPKTGWRRFTGVAREVVSFWAWKLHVT